MRICPDCYSEAPLSVRECPACGAELADGAALGPPPSTEELPSTKPLSQIKRAAAEAAAERARAKADATPLPGPSTAEFVSPLASGLRLKVLRGLRMNVEYLLHEGSNLVGRRDESPIDIDMTDQEPVDRTEVSRQHAIVTLLDGHLAIEDLRSKNGTFVNRVAVKPGEKCPLRPNDVVQIGKIQLKVTS